MNLKHLTSPRSCGQTVLLPVPRASTVISETSADEWISISWEGAGSDDIRLDGKSTANLADKISKAILSVIEDQDVDDAEASDMKRQQALLAKALRAGKTLTIKFA